MQQYDPDIQDGDDDDVSVIVCEITMSTHVHNVISSVSLLYVEPCFSSSFSKVEIYGTLEKIINENGEGDIDDVYGGKAMLYSINITNINHSRFLLSFFLPSTLSVCHAIHLHWSISMLIPHTHACVYL